MAAGTSLASQFDFDGYLSARKTNLGRTFRQPLRQVGGEIEE